MINFFKSLKKIFLTRDDPLNHQNQVINSKNNQSNKISFSQQISSLTKLVGSKTELLIEDLKIMREKCRNLPKTNYDLGMKYLDNGNLKEAIFRFKITKKFWPEYYDAYYQLAYCLIIDGKFQEAELVIKDLLLKNPDYSSKIEQLFEIVKKELSSDL